MQYNMVQRYEMKRKDKKSIREYYYMYTMMIYNWMRYIEIVGYSKYIHPSKK